MLYLCTQVLIPMADNSAACRDISDYSHPLSDGVQLINVIHMQKQERVPGKHMSKEQHRNPTHQEKSYHQARPALASNPIDLPASSLSFGNEDRERRETLVLLGSLRTNCPLN